MIDRNELLDVYALEERMKRHLRINFISSADGAVTFSGHSGALGGPTDRLLLHVLRAMADVVVVGAGTVRAEGYGGLGATDEDVAWRRENGLSDVPALAVVSNRLNLAPGSDVFRRRDGRTIVLTHEAAPADQVKALSEVADVIPCGSTHVEVPRALAELEFRGYTQILSEGGPHLFGSMLAADLVDEVCLTISPKFVAGDADRIAASAAQLDRDFQPGNVIVDDDGFIFIRYVRSA